jgi:hypothetical protein
MITCRNGRLEKPLSLRTLTRQAKLQVESQQYSSPRMPRKGVTVCFRLPKSLVAATGVVASVCLSRAQCSLRVIREVRTTESA